MIASMTPKFAKAVDPIFMHVLRLLDRIENSESPNPEEDQLQIRSLIDQAEALLGAGPEWELAKYALVSWIDEMLVDAPWESREWWKNNVLEQQIFSSRKRHQQFFISAQQASELIGKDALEVFYVCVILGFRGLYHDPSSGPALAQSLGLPPDLDAWAKQSELSIRLGQDRPPLGAPGAEVSGAAPLLPVSTVVWPWLVSLMLGTVAILYFYHWSTQR